MGNEKTSINIPLDDNNVIYGIEEYVYSSEDYTKALKCHNKIKKDIGNIKESYIRLGAYFVELRASCAYTCFGYSNLYDYIKNNFGLEKSAVSRCINVFETFAVSVDARGKVQLDDKYKDFSYSQLSEMLSLTGEEREKITPDMPVSAIRKMKKKRKNVIDVEVKEVAMSQPEEEPEMTEEEYLYRSAIYNEFTLKNTRYALPNLSYSNMLFGHYLVHSGN